MRKTGQKLGVQINVEHMCDGRIEVDNTASRRSEISESIRQILHDGNLPRMEALKLRGRMQFASGQLFGRVAKRTLAVAVVTQHAYSAESAKLAPEAMASLRRFLSIVESHKPRVISRGVSETWLTFTDASHEPDSDRPLGGIGAVLVDGYGVKQRFFSEEILQSLMEQINVTKRKTLIFECEFLMQLMAHDQILLCRIRKSFMFLKRCRGCTHSDTEIIRCLHSSSPLSRDTARTWT